MLFFLRLLFFVIKQLLLLKLHLFDMRVDSELKDCDKPGLSSTLNSRIEFQQEAYIFYEFLALFQLFIEVSFLVHADSSVIEG